MVKVIIAEWRKTICQVDFITFACAPVCFGGGVLVLAAVAITT